MAREYVTNVGKVPNSPREAEKLAIGFQKKALGYLDGTMRSDDGRNMVRATLSMYTSSPAVFDDLAKMFMGFARESRLASLPKASRRRSPSSKARRSPRCSIS